MYIINNIINCAVNPPESHVCLENIVVDSLALAYSEKYFNYRVVTEYIRSEELVTMAAIYCGGGGVFPSPNTTVVLYVAA